MKELIQQQSLIKKTDKYHKYDTNIEGVYVYHVASEFRPRLNKALESSNSPIFGEKAVIISYRWIHNGVLMNRITRNRPFVIENGEVKIDR